MSEPLRLPRVRDLAADLPALRDALSQQLLGHKTDSPFSFRIEEDEADPYGRPAAYDPRDGVVSLTPATAAALSHGDDDALLALAHQLFHSIGEGAAFPYSHDQRLEEAAVEILTQCYYPAVAAALGFHIGSPAPLFTPLPDADDLQVSRVTASNVAVERFGRLAAWLEDLDGTDEAGEIEAAAVRWAINVKAHPGDQRFKMLARAAAGVDQADGADDVSAAEWFEEYLSGYMLQPWRSKVGFAGLRYASAKAWLDGGLDKPVPRKADAADAWRNEIQKIEAVTFSPLPPDGEIDKALASATGEVSAAVHRSLDERHLLWIARALDIARMNSKGEASP
jgi:hypothetical protein